ncbi:hypothetical protein BKA81DRAFT_102152 [Phyllosticta paracitricarpa]
MNPCNCQSCSHNGGACSGCSCCKVPLSGSTPPIPCRPSLLSLSTYLVEVNILGNCSTALGWLCALRLYLSSSSYCSGTRNGSLFSLAGFVECECQSHSFNIFMCPSAFVMRMS